MKIERNDWSYLMTLFKRAIDVDDITDPTLKVGQIAFDPETGEKIRLTFKHNGKNYYTKGDNFNNRTNEIFRADKKGLVVPNDPVHYGNSIQSAPLPILYEMRTALSDEIKGKESQVLEARNG